MANGRGIKLSNDYAVEFGALYEKTPKSVFAAIALSLAFIQDEEKGFDFAVKCVLDEWSILYQNGLVPQKPPALTKDDLRKSARRA